MKNNREIIVGGAEMRRIAILVVLYCAGGCVTVTPEPRYGLDQTPQIIATSKSTIQVMTFPIVQDSTMCFPQRPVTVRLRRNLVVLEDVKWYANRKPWLNDNRIGIGQDEKWGFCDSTGEIVITPQFDDIRPFDHGHAVVVQGEKYGYIKADGSWLKKPQYGWAYDFTMGLGVVNVDDKWGIINTNGDWVEEPRFKRLTRWSEAYWLRRLTEMNTGIRRIQIFGRIDINNHLRRQIKGYV